jgi:hypothetical protein
MIQNLGFSGSYDTIHLSFLDEEETKSLFVSAYRLYNLDYYII